MVRNVTIQAYNERAMGKGVYFHRLRRITGFLNGTQLRRQNSKTE